MHSSKEQKTTNITVIPGAPLWRRILAIFYDSIMVACVIFIAWQPMPLLPFDQLPAWLGKGIRLTYLFFVAFAFFGWFWTHGGQTVGMRAWKVRLVDHQALESQVRDPGLRQALYHYVFALISWCTGGLGFLASLWNPDRRTWHDRAAGTALVLVVQHKS